MSAPKRTRAEAAGEELAPYRAKRDFGATPEPAGEPAGPDGGGERLRFVVQEHSATRLHWDLRLEHHGALASWAIPNGIPEDPKQNRKAVHTEDHPLEYLDFHGQIPKGSYGAGTMHIWDSGTYELHKWEPRKVEVTFHGERLRGRYGLFPAGEDPKDWMIHRMDPPADPSREPMPEHVLPMLATAGRLPRDDGHWAYEVKWDGVRALVYSQPGRLRLESRNLADITASYPELHRLNRDLSSHDAILDGEIVAFDEEGRPSFARLQQRMHVASESAARRRARAVPVTIVLFDLLFLDGHRLAREPYAERRARLEGLALEGPAWRTPSARRGDGDALLEATRRQGLEGIVAKRLDSPYEPGRRSPCWIKVKNARRVRLAIAGWMPGTGRRRERIGALLLGAREPDGLRYAGRVGTGFTEKMLDDLAETLAPLERATPPFVAGRPPRGAVWVEPELTAEVEYTDWTAERVLRHPSYKGLVDDEPEPVGDLAPAQAPDPATPGDPESLFGDVRRDRGGALEATVEGRRLRLSNWEKVLYPQTGFTKGDLIAYYARIAPTVLPHLHDRPLTLKRYPNGVEAKYFYEKQCPSHRPDWVGTANLWSRHNKAEITFCLAQDLPTLVWAANLADIELHTPLARAVAIDQPTMVVFDLDPGPPAALLECCRVALVLRGLFERLGLECLVKTSGSKGMQIYLPLNAKVTYEETKPFARTVAELLERQLPDLVVSRMTKTLRDGKVLVDWSQNDEHKTTVSVYSVRARERPTVSTPLAWDEVTAAHEEGDAASLVFDTEAVLARVAERGDLFAPALSTVQELPPV